MPECIGVKFENGPKLHYVEAPPQLPEVNTQCIVSTRRGLELGVVRTGAKDVTKPNGHYVRQAQADDVHEYKQLKQRAEDLKWLLKARVKEHVNGVKIINLEFNLDESLLVVSYTSERDLPLRILTQELMQHTNARIDFVNVGPRDQARILGTLGACGSGSCSSTWLQQFNAVSIRMARDQQLPLNPEKISGPCGRLMCCLQYEHDMYKELLKRLPKKGVRACHSESGACGRVIKLNPLKQTVDMKLDDGKYAEYPADELELTKHARRASNS